MLRTALAVAVLLVLAPAAAATPQEDLAAAEGRWAALAATDYSFTVREQCFCPSRGPWTARVESGVPKGDAPERVATVPALFAQVREAIDLPPDQWSVTYDARTGVPTQFAVDPIKMAVDDEYGFTVTDIQVGKPVPVEDEVDPEIADGSAAAALADARRRWRARGLRDYDFRLRVICFCTPEFTRPRAIRVRKGKPRRPGQVRAYATVPRLFGVIEKAIAGRVASLEVRYGRTGLPRMIAIDVDRFALDEEQTFRATRLRAR